MSTNETVLNTSNQATTNYDTSKLLLWDNKFIKADYTNSGYDDVTLAVGTVMGRVAATGKVIPLQSDASDGSQFPVGVLSHGYIVEGGDTVEVSICNGGTIAEEKVVLVKVGDTLNTIISGKIIRDRLAGDTLGIELNLGSEQTQLDNQ